MRAIAPTRITVRWAPDGTTPAATAVIMATVVDGHPVIQVINPDRQINLAIDLVTQAVTYR